MTDTLDVMDTLLKENLGITSAELDTNNDVDRLLYVVVGEYARHRANAIRRAQDAIQAFARVAATPVTQQIDQIGSYPEQYREAVAATQALNGPLGSAFKSYKRAHGLNQQKD